MPYIKQERRYAVFNRQLDADLLTAGDINYFITKAVKAYLGSTPNYERFNAAIGLLESAKLELYRRMVAPYEDTKIKENGDVY